MEDLFPEGFLWGTATAGFQVEMGADDRDIDPNTDWFLWTHDQRNVEEGVVSGDLPEEGPGFFSLYREDWVLAREMGNNAVRLSLEWSRLFPRSIEEVPVRVERGEGGWILGVEVPEASMQMLEERASREAVERYRSILEEARSFGLTPLLTLNHFTLPLWLHDPLSSRDDIYTSPRRGWVEENTVIEFAKYCAFTAKTFGDLVDLWATLNEPMVVAINGYLMGRRRGFPPGIVDPQLCLRVSKNLAVAHSLGYQQIKVWDRHSCTPYGPAYVGVVHNPQVYTPADPSLKEDLVAAEAHRYYWNEWYLNAALHGEFDLNLDGVIRGEEYQPSLARGCDFLGVNYYRIIRVKGDRGGGPVHPLLKGTSIPCQRNCSDAGWEIYPQGIRETVRWVYLKYRRPIIITENGIADQADTGRKAFLLHHLEELQKALEEDGVPVEGYFHWSLMDNFEWAKGFSMRFGLYRTDYQTKKRQPTRAVEVYREICSTNKLPRSEG